MTTSREHGPDPLVADWQAIDAPGASAETLQRYVRSRGRLLRAWIVGEVLVGLTALPVLGYLTWTTHDPVDRLAMLALIAITCGALTFTWRSWRGVMRPSADTTMGFVELSIRRLRRARLACRSGWAVLLAEIVVFSVWIAHRLDHADPAASLFAWGLLVTMTTGAALFLFGLQRWITRDERRLEDLRRELGDLGQ